MQTIPEHIAIIPDGNRRWAKNRKLQPWKGHQEGAKRFEEVLDEALKLNIKYLTFWAAAESNLTERNKIEVGFLGSIAKSVLENHMADSVFDTEQVNVRIIGKWNELLHDKKLAELISAFEERTRNYTRHHLTILFGYDGRREMTEGINKMIQESCKENTAEKPELSPSTITYQDISDNIWTGHLPPVDLVIRTGGEPHWSAGFMMWKTTDSQFYFTEKFWPDFTKEELHIAIEDYGNRTRRFGK